MQYLPEGIFVIAYIILGAEIVWTAVKNLFGGKVFDENFLMSIATIGAFVVGDFAEAVGVMLFYRIGELFEDVAVNKSRKQIMEAVDMRPEMVRLYEEGKVIEVDPEDVKLVIVSKSDRETAFHWMARYCEAKAVLILLL